MPSVQIKNVPEETARVLRRRAAEAHQSLQEYLLARLVAEASRPTMEEFLACIESDVDAEFTFEDVVDIVRADRDRR